MSKRRRTWRYLKRPLIPEVTLSNGWEYVLGMDRVKETAVLPDETHEIVVNHVDPGTGDTTNYFGVKGEPTISFDHVRDDITGRWMLHMMVNMSRFEREPDWEEWKALREAFFPHDVDTAIILPALENYVNVSEWVFHLWQLPEVWSVTSWGTPRRLQKG